jgi:hypothetical protein
MMSCCKVCPRQRTYLCYRVRRLACQARQVHLQLLPRTYILLLLLRCRKLLSYHCYESW